MKSIRKKLESVEKRAGVEYDGLQIAYLEDWRDDNSIGCIIEDRPGGKLIWVNNALSEERIIAILSEISPRPGMTLDELLDWFQNDYLVNHETAD